MTPRRLIAFISLFSTLTLQNSQIHRTTCLIPPANVSYTAHSGLPVHYIPGGGKDFINCVNNRYRSEFRRLRDFFNVRTKGRIDVEYTSLDGIGGFYSLRESRIYLDTSKVLYVTGIADCSSLGHELAHAFEDIESQEESNGKWPEYSNPREKNFSLDDYGINIISEGLANYAGNQTLRKKFPTNWPQNREQFYCADKYVLGEYIVTRPIRELGPERAIPVMLRNPPRGNQVLIPSTWQNQIINQVRNHRQIVRK